MNVKELKERLGVLPDDMPVLLLDWTTDDPYASSYSIADDNIGVHDYLDEEDGEVLGKALWIGFKNKLNENPI